MVSSLKKFGYHEWLCKTNFSFLIGASHPHEMVAQALKHQYTSFCVNDFDGAYGLARTYGEWQRLKGDAALQLNFGAEIHLTKDHELPILMQKTLVLIAKTKEGYHNLCKILTYSHRAGKTFAHVPLADLVNFDLSDLIALQPMRGLIREPTTDDYFISLKESFENFHLVVSRHLHPLEDRWLPAVLQISKRLAIPYIISQDAFFHRREEKPLSDLLHAIRNNRLIHQCGEHFFPNGERCLHPQSALLKLYGDLPAIDQALQVSYELNEQCTFDIAELRYHYPKEMIPEGQTAFSYLQELTWQGIRKFYGESPPQKIFSLVNHELALIKELQFADYFLTVWDIVRWARSQDILCQGRGSAANSAVCYALGITSADPALFDLLFERFISKERGDPPDIDVDFEHERREEVIQYIYQRYGRKRAAMVANVITYKRKGAMRAAGKALGFNDSTLKKMSSLSQTVHYRRQAVEAVINQVRSEEHNLQFAPNWWELWIELAGRLRGFPRHLGIHSGGFMLSDQDLDRLVPQEPATMAGRTVVQWSKEDIENLGFFKIDILCLGMLTALRKCFKFIEDHHHKKLSMYEIPPDDQPTYTMIQKADTVGVFQIESRAQMSMLPRLRPKCFYDLVIEIAIIRPGPIQGNVIHPYLRRRHGLEPVTYPDIRLQPILQKTLGIPLFQEQAMRIAIAVGDFTPGEANELRKNIGTWNMKSFARDINPWLEKLERGLKNNGIEKKFIDYLMGQMKGFVAYGFPESHAISFAFIAYASCYLKCHYPAAFFAAILNSQPMGFYSPHALLQAAQHAGVNLLPICVNSSGIDHQLEPDKLKAESWAIRLGFRLVNGLSTAAANIILEKRSTGAPRWESLNQFIADCPIHRDDFTALAAANAFHSFGMDRKEALWQAEAVPFKPLVDDEERKLTWPVEEKIDGIQHDFHAFNTSLIGHPIPLIRNRYWDFAFPPDNIAKAKDLVHIQRNRIITVFGMVIVKQAPPSAKGMVFVTLEDETGTINIAFTPQVYSRSHQLVEKMPFLCIQGLLQKDHGSYSVLVKKVFARESTHEVLYVKRKTGQHPRNAHLQIQQPRRYM